MSIKHKKCFKKTNDDWHPNFDGDLVAVSLILHRKNSREYKLYGSTCLFRVCVWGADDFGMEKDFFGEEKDCVEQAKELYAILEKKDIIYIADLKKLGFINA